MSRLINVNIDIETESHWISSTDLMSGLMLIFMLIAISYMLNVSSDRDRIKDIANQWAITKEKIYQALLEEFRDDLPKWNAEIEKKSLVVRFKEPTVLFHKGDTHLTNKFKIILKDFFPRYLKILQQFSDSIAEIRIEGHTSSEWNNNTSTQLAYLNNMRLSHGRTLEVLTYCFSITKNRKFREWAKHVIVAIGMSSSKIIKRNGIEDKKASRRVEFRVRTKADENLSMILKQND